MSDSNVLNQQTTLLQEEIDKENIQDTQNLTKQNTQQMKNHVNSSIITKIQNLIEYNLESYYSNMWENNAINNVQDFILNQEHIFIWVQNNSLQFAYTLADLLSKDNKNQLLYISKLENIVIEEENFDQIILTKCINKNNGLLEIVQDISDNLITEIIQDKQWPENVKKELLVSTHKFLQNINENLSKKEKNTYLYVPNELLFFKNITLEFNSPDYKDLIQRLEMVLVHWTKQIKEVINIQMNENEQDNSGPLEEIDFWRNCEKNLVNISKQLENSRVKKILQFLKKNNSNQLKNLEKITEKIQAGLDLSQDNLKYLKIFEIPCKQLLVMNSSQIPSIMNQLFFCIRMLWEKCKDYQTEEKIANLFRKVSNEIIKRCGVTINLDDLFEGNVQSCLKELNLSKKCGQQWREVYDLNIRVMDKQTQWKFEANYIFAQIDAFVQRCNDLQEICEGQIQFARKGKEDVLPYFTGSKSNEIIFILNEINESFNKYLNKLKGQNKQRILDIKSTQWHDDYNLFKQGMKNLDNMYINLVNFAFDHIYTMEQAIEYMVAFKTLTQRETIKIHVDKKIEKVNQIAIRELRAAETFSKTSPNLRRYPGKESAKSTWCKNLLTRVQRIKWLYDKLIWIKQSNKESVEIEYYRIEKNLKSMINECFKEFKEKNKDLNTTLLKRLDQNILIESNVARNKSLVPKSTHPILQNRKNQIGFIECNFDKILLQFIEELQGFQQLGSYGNSFGGKAEEIVNQQSLKLKIYRENVMQIVREYNQILKLMNPFERGLFSDHLEKVTITINRGVKILRWSSHGTLDNFVKECKTKCQILNKKIIEFQQGSKLVEKKIKQISENMKYIQFDSRTVHELSIFINKQERVQVQSQNFIFKIFQEIEEILSNLYDFFINKSEKIQKFWFQFIKNLDLLLDEEFKKSSKISFQELLKAMIGDEKTNTNPTQIFRIFIVLNVQEKENLLDFEPNTNELQHKVYYMLQNTIKMFSQFQKLPILMYNSRNNKIQQIMNEYEKDNQGKKHQNKNIKLNFINITQDMLNCEQKDYEEIVRKEVDPILKEIQTHLSSQCLKLSSQLEPWLQQEFVRNSGQDGNKFKNNLLYDSNTPVQILMNEVSKYDYISTQIQEEKNSDDSVCIHVDNSRIKSKLGEINYNEQKNLLNKIKTMSIKELLDLTRKFDEAQQKFSKNPIDLHQLDESIKYVSLLNQQKVNIEESLLPLEEKFRLLDENMMVFKEEETKLRIGIKENFEKFCLMLDEVKIRNDSFFLAYQKDHLRKLQSFEKDIREYKDSILTESPISIDQEISIEKAFLKIFKFQETLQEIKNYEKDLQFGFNLFKIDYSPIPQIKEIQNQIINLEKFWGIKKNYEDIINKYCDIQFNNINIQDIKNDLKNVKEDINEFNIIIKKWEVTQDLNEEIEKLEKTLKLIDLLKDYCFRPRHWKVVIEGLKENISKDSLDFTFEKIQELNLLRIQDVIKTQQEIAFNEYKIEISLQKVIERWNKEELKFEKIKNSNDEIIDVRYMDKVTEFLEEDLILLSSLKTNINAKFFMKEIDNWDSDLNKISEILDLIIQVQKKFIYFNSIFLNLKEEIGQLKSDKSNFINVKKVFLQYINDFQENKNTKSNFLIANFRETLLSLSFQLETIQKNMRKYLEKRRYEIPRFYFLSDEDIFEILGKTKDPNSINKNIKKMFEGIKKLDYVYTQSNKYKIAEYTHMMAQCEEKVEFNRRIEINGDLNYVLKNIEYEMQQKLQTLICESMNFLKNNNLSFQKDLEKVEKWINDFPGQILLLSSQLTWTNKMTENITKNQEGKNKKITGKDEWTVYKNQSQKFINDLILLIRKKNSNIIKLKLIALITIEMHQKDLIEKLQNCQTNSYEWLQQLRFYPSIINDEKIIVTINQGPGKFDYGYEYQGNNGRLVITPLTDRCYQTLTTALHYKRGGNPQGPAGTGKTETVKDLGKNLGRYVFVYNCSEGIDVKNMRDLFEGLIMTGFWGCFDEFNRIEIEVLSVIAIQINSILEAIAQNKNVFDFEDKELNLDKNCALFITMNPTYSGRTELPDNIKNLFRPISMMVPDSSKICRISLQAEGFKFSDILSKKIDSFYNFMKQNLSRQQHYDFGLRAIKSVLNLAGEFRRNQKRKEILKKEQDQIFEQRMLIKAILAMNEPKLISNDLFLFEALLNDVFQEELENSKEENEELLKFIDKVMDEMNLDKNPYFVEKLIQLYYTKQSRPGNIVIGESTSGKSSLCEVLRRVQDLMDNPTKKFTLNPKVFSIQEIYGYYDSVSDESKIGVFSHLMTELCIRDETDNESWIVFDGPIDTKWIESMNSLLDDNRVLTLLDGNRINLKQNVKIFFEVDELNQASPATVSRCGMLYVDSKELTWKSVFIGWILKKDEIKVPDSLLDFLEDLSDKWIQPIIEFKKKIQNMILTPLSELTQVKNFGILFDILYQQHYQDKIPNEKTLKINDSMLQKIEKLFVFCIVWSLGTNLNSEGRIKFDHYLRDIEGLFPFSLQVFDYFLNFEKNEFFPWDSKLTVTPQQFKPPEQLKDKEYLVETVDTLRLRYFTQILLENNINLLNVGVSGVGKTALTKQILYNLDENLYSYNIINLTPGTTSQRLQDNLESKLNRTTKKKFRPFSGKKGIVFIDNLSLPKKDEFGYQPTLELIRQFLEESGWYDRSQLDIFIDIKDLTCITSMRESSIISMRLLNKYFLLSTCLPNESELKRIYSSILYYNLQDFDAEEIKPELENISKFIIQIFKSVVEENSLKSTPNQPHYIFSMKDMTRVVQGIGLINKLNCDSRNVLMKLITHECRRVYSDKMFNQEHREFLDNKINEELENIFNVSLKDIESIENPILFSNFFDVKKQYSLINENQEENWCMVLKNLLNEQLEKYNQEQTKPMNIVLFQEAILQICKINRVLNIKQGNLLLIGQGGTGRHSLTKLSSFINEHSIYEKKKGEDKIGLFRQSIKEIFEKIIFKNFTYVLLLSDTAMKSEEILEDVNSLLSLGEIPNLYQKKEGRDDFLNIREKLKLDNPEENDEQIYNTFIEQIKKHLHIVFCCSQNGETLRYYTRNYSGMIFNTTQIYFEKWPIEALIEVGKKFLEIENFENVDLLSNYLAYVHENVNQTAIKMSNEIQRNIYVTQKNFVDFSLIFRKLLKEKELESNERINKYENGLKKLQEATENVDQLKNDMEIKKLDLNNKKKDSEEMFYKIKDEKSKSEKEKKQIEKKESDLQLETNQIQKLADDAQEQLKKALPALEAANEQVATLDAQSIAQIKAFLKTKNKKLELIMFAIMVLLKEKQDWGTVQKVVVDPNFLKRLRELDKDKITEDRIQRLEKYTQQPEIQGNLSSYSLQVQILKEYIIAVEQYVKINLDVDPIRKRVKKLHMELELKTNELLTLKQKYQKNLQELNILNQRHQNQQNDYLQCEDEFSQLEQRLDRSQKLVNGLSSSQQAWEEHKEYYIKFKDKLLGGVMLTAPILSYFGPFPSEYREDLLENILKIFLRKNNIDYSNTYNFVYFLVPENEILEWNFKGLPDDKVSIDNGVIVKKSQNWPLMVDPQAQGLNWITQLEKENNLIILDSTESRVNKIIKKAIQDGTPLLLRNIVDNIPMDYEPILEKNIKQLGPSRYMIYFGEEQLQYNPNFRFYITTRQNNPNFSPDIFSSLTFVNFSVKQKGLEEQILGVVLRVFDEKIENSRIDCIKTKAKCQKTLDQLENKILQMLQDERGMPLVDDLELIETLEISKEKEDEIKMTIDVNKATMKKNLNARENYRYIGFVVSLLFFAIQQLEKIEYIYQFPLERYIQLFETTLINLKENKNELSDSLQEKIKKIDLTFRKQIYNYVQKGLFEKDKLLLSFLMAINLAPIDEKNSTQNKQEDQKKKNAFYKKLTQQFTGEDNQEENTQPINYYEQLFQDEYKFFVEDNPKIDKENMEQNPEPNWIKEKMWNQIHELNKLPNFQGILGSFLHSTREWRSIFNSPRPEQEILPSDWSTKIKGFSLILLIKILRPDRIIFTCKNYVQEILGKYFIESQNFDFNEVYSETLKYKHNVPILILMGPNLDPWTYVENLARQNEQQVIQISLGKGQIQKAKEKVLQGSKEGFWVYLGNIHLSIDFMKQLQMLCDYFSTNKKNSNFQLFLSSKPVEILPLSVLHSSIKITLEPFKGMKSNMHNLIKNLIPNYEPQQDNESYDTFIKYKKIIYTLSWFHSLLNERKRFKNLGWNVSYEFSDSDFLFAEKILKQQIQNLEGKKENLQWENIRNLISRINYGGRVTDEWDQKLIDIYSQDFFKEDIFSNPNFNFVEHDEESQYIIIKESEENQFANQKGNNLQYFYSGFKDEIIKQITNFPENEEPNIFGQHINADIKMKIETSKEMLKSLQILLLGTNGQDSNQINSVFNQIENIKKLLPENLKLDQFYSKLQQIYKDLKTALIQPLNTVVLQESEKYNKLLNIINNDIDQIEKCLLGQILISEEIEQMVQNIFLYQVPPKWKSFYLSQKPLIQWLQDLKDRVEQIDNWLQKGSLTTYWLGGLVYPSGFLTAILQKTARKIEIPIDDLKFEFNFIENEANINPNIDGIYIKKLYLEGASWNSIKGVLEDSKPMTLYSNMPIILFKPVEKINLNHKLSYYDCPTYTYPNRTGENDKQSFLLTIQLPFQEKDYQNSFWTKRGTALLLQNDE